MERSNKIKITNTVYKNRSFKDYSNKLLYTNNDKNLYIIIDNHIDILNTGIMLFNLETSKYISICVSNLNLNKSRAHFGINLVCIPFSKLRELSNYSSQTWRLIYYDILTTEEIEEINFSYKKFSMYDSKIQVCSNQNSNDLGVYLNTLI